MTDKTGHTFRIQLLSITITIQTSNLHGLKQSESANTISLETGTRAFYYAIQ